MPLGLSPGTTVAVIGEFARTPRYQGSGRSRVRPTRLETFLDEFSARVGEGVEVRFAPGFALEDDALVDDLAEHATRVASGTECVILLLGLPYSAESEGFDRDHLDLPASQIALLRRLRLLGSPIVVLLANGGVVDIASWSDDSDAILECWLGGQAGASAAAQLVLGQAEPGGRLAETIPMRLADSPAFVFAEWLADPRDRAALLRTVGTGGDGRPKGIVGDAGRIRVVGNFPLRSLAVFPGTGLTHEIVDAICAELASEA